MSWMSVPRPFFLNKGFLSLLYAKKPARIHTAYNIFYRNNSNSFFSNIRQYFVGIQSAMETQMEEFYNQKLGMDYSSDYRDENKYRRHST